MINSKYSRGSYIHRALERIEREPQTRDRLRREIASVSIARFNESIIQPLITDGFATIDREVLMITEKGRAKYEELGPVKDKLPPTFAGARKNNVFAGTYDGKELRPQQNRLEGNDHLALPSRVDDTLYYRDGRVVELT